MSILPFSVAICFRKFTHTAGAIFSDVAEEIRRRERMQEPNLKQL